MLNLKKSWKLKKYWGLAVCFSSLILLLLYQNCSQQEMTLSLKSVTGLPLRSSSRSPLQSPLIAKKIDRYIFLVDMSFSMISGPCPQDVDGNKLFKRGESRRTVNGWDPNKLLRDRSISDYQQSAAFDCYVDPDLDIDSYLSPSYSYRVADLTPGDPPTQNPTIVGSDYQANRLSIVTQWIAQLRANLSEERKADARVLIVPYTSGAAKGRLFSRINFDFDQKFQFRGLNDNALDTLLEDLGQVHKETRLKAINQDDYHRWKDRAMGASSPTEAFDPLYNVVLEDMDWLADNGALRRTRYNMFLISDGMLTPIKEQIDIAVKTHDKCDGCDSSGGTCADFCRNIRDELIEALGDPVINTNMMLILKMGKIQALTDFYGAGKIVNNFIQVNHDYHEKIYGHVDSLFEILAEEFEKYKYHYEYWELDGNKLPFDLASNQIEYRNFSLTGVIILNPNLRVATDGSLQYDSDADGLFDSDEQAMGTDPLNPRSNGVCLDSLAVHPAHQQKCASLAQVPDCDFRLDTDMDSLNECEERLLGTDPHDFDTDNDLIPDYFEWTYEFNPLLNEKNHDTNGDGITNLKAFLAGLGPSHSFGNIDENFLVRFQINEEVTDQRHEDMWISAFTINIDNIPFGLHIMSGAIPSQYPCLMYNTRTRSRDPCEVNAIQNDELLFHTNSQPNFNKGVALLRLRDRDNEKNLVWKIMKFDMSDQNRETNVFELSHFRDFKVLDEVDH